MQFAQRQRPYQRPWKPLLAALMLGLALGFAGPFGSNPAYSTAVRYAFWVAMTLAGTLAAIAADMLVPQRLGSGKLARPFVIATISAIPMTFVVAWTMSLLQPGRFFAPLQLLSLYGAVTAVQLLIVLVTVGRAASAQNRADVDRPQSPESIVSTTFPPALLAKLPPAIGTNIVALETEDHYLRVHTADGSALVLMRMADAVAMIDPALGAQVHRRWWVADAAVDTLETDGQKLSLRLTDGRRIPVGRTFAAMAKTRINRRSPKRR